MTPDERPMVQELVHRELAAGRGDGLVAALTESGLGLELWTDPAATADVFEVQGRLCARSALLNPAVLHSAAAEDRARLVLPPLGSSAPPGRVIGDRIVIDGVALADAADLPWVVGSDSDDLLQVDELPTVPLSGLDPGLQLVRVSGTVVISQCSSAIVSGGWETLLARAAHAIGHELIGLAEATIRMATEHAGQRRQFGQPLSAFQVIRHRLADAHISQVAARDVLRGLEKSADAHLVLQVGKALAGRAALLAVAVAQQLCGAMGFTDEFGLHRFVRRAYLLDSLFGGSEDAERELGDRALATVWTPDRFVMLGGRSHG